MAKAPRHTRLAAKQLARMGPPVSPKKEYVITNPTHKPDLKGEFAGVKVRKLGADQVVLLTSAQAQYYLAQGAIKLRAAPQSEKAEPKLAPSPSQPERSIPRQAR